MSNETSARIEGEHAPVCNVPPAGWRCSRGRGHEGPCAASPVCIHGVGWPGDCAGCLADEPKVGESGLSDEQAHIADTRGLVCGCGKYLHHSGWLDCLMNGLNVRGIAKPEPLPNTLQEERSQEDIDNARMAMQGTPREKAWEALFETHVALQSALRERDAEAGRWQAAIYELLVKATNDSIDGGGCDSGDPLDFTLAEISQALEILKSAAPKAVDSKEEQEANPHPEDVKLHYQTLKLMNEALEATRDSKQSSAYRVAEFAVCMKPDPTEEQDYSECPYCGGKWIRKASITNCPMCETMIGRITPIAAPKVVDSKEEICRHCHKTFDSHPDPGLNCYSEGTFSTRWEPIVDLRSKVEEQKCEPCRGSGRHIAGSDCPNCNGTGKAKVEDPYICTDPECFGDCHPIRKPKVEEQDGEREPLRHPFSLRDTAIIEVSKLGIGDVEDVTAACDYPDNSDEAGCTSVCVGVMERALKAEAENKLLKAESVAPPSLPTNSPCCMCGQVMVFGQICTAWEGYCHPAPTQKLIDLLNASRAAAPVTLPTHQIVSSNDWGEGHQVELRCSCGRTFIGLGDEALASSRASFEAHLPEKEGK